MSVKPVPDGYHTVTPYLIVKGGAQAIDFYKKAFGAVEKFRMPGPGGKVSHAEIEIGDSRVMLADEFPERGIRAPEPPGNASVSIMLYVNDADAVAKQAVAAGGKVVRPVETQFYGDRMGAVTDPFGHTWHIGTHVEDVSPDEMQKRMAAMQHAH